MKQIIRLLLACTLVFAGASTAVGQASLTAEAEGGIWTDGFQMYLTPSCTIKFTLRLTNNSGHAITNLFNGFKVYTRTESGQLTGHYTVVKVDTLAGILSPFLDFGPSIDTLGLNGQGEDTIGFGGLSITTDGIPDGFDEPVYSISVRATAAVGSGEFLCLDSSWIPPGGEWLWSTWSGNIIPAWNGPLCYELMTCPCGWYEFADTATSIEVGHCDHAQYDFVAANALNPDLPANFMLLDGPGDITGNGDSVGVWKWDPTASDIGHTYTVTVEAGGSGECARKSLQVHVIESPFGFEAACGNPVILAQGDTAVANVGVPAQCYTGFVVDDGGAPAGACSLDSDGYLHFESDASCRGLYNVQLGLTDQTDTVFCTVPVLVTDQVCLMRGNVDGDITGGGAINVADLTWLVAYLFSGGLPPTCTEEGNVDGVGGINVSDLTYLVAYIFKEGPQPPPCS